MAAPMKPAEVHALAVAHGLSHEQAIVATAIAWAESNLKPDAVGDVDLEDAKWGPSVGIYQVRSLRADTGTGNERDVERLGEPAFNTRAMVAISAGGTKWTPWSVFKNGRYQNHLSAVRAAVTEGAPTVATVRGGKVLPHVQAFADAVQTATGVQSIGTYPGHSPSIDRALDLFVPTTSATLGNAISAHAINNQEQFGVRYVIFRQRIWHRLDPVWRGMEDRGDLTQNHYDHVHVSFETVGAAVPDQPTPPPKPKPIPEEDDDTMRLIGVTNNRGIFLVGSSPLATGKAKGKAPARHIDHPAKIDQLVAAGVVPGYNKQPDLPEELFDNLFTVVG